jgi:outer membrane protein OmpA-like peptidoglycan-associated protein
MNIFTREYREKAVSRASTAARASNTKPLPEALENNGVMAARRALVYYVTAIIALLCAFSAELYAQIVDSSARTRFGVFGQATYNMHRASFTGLPGAPSCCPQFTDAAGFSFALGGLFDLPLSDAFGLSLRASYAPTPALFVNPETSPLTALQNIGGEAISGSFFNHVLNASLGSVGAEALLTFKPFTRETRSDDGFTVLLGARAGYMIERSFAQREETFADSVIFVDTRSRLRNEQSGDISGASELAFSLMGGVAWEIPLNQKRTVLLTPEIFYSFPLTPVIPDGAWSGSWAVHQIRFGLALKFAPERRIIDTSSAPPPTNDNPPVFVVRETPPPPPSPSGVQTGGRELSASLSVVGVERDGKEIADVIFRVEEFLSTNLRPLLPYVFFEQDSDNIPERYERLSPREIEGFDVDKLHNFEMLETYHHILNIIGQRMRAHPQAQLAITGCNDNTSAGERGNLSLSYRRAKATRDYLSGIWKIDTSRMPIQIRNLPATPTVSNTKMYELEVMQENRRVEFASDTWEILEPIKTSDTVRTVSPPIVRFRPRVALPVGKVKEWQISVGQQGKTLKVFAGKGDIPATLDWNIAENQATVPRAPTPLEYTMDVTDEFGNRLAATGAAPVEQITLQRKRRERMNDKEVDRYSLILFDFDKSNLTTAQNRIASFIKRQIQPQADVRITGYTDYTNPLDYSLRLSKARARETASALDRIRSAEVRGLGKTVLLYDTEIPEGRFYCRTVTIVVETPITRE